MTKQASNGHEWTRIIKVKRKKGRVFTPGASEDILNAGYRRMIVNGVYWSLGLENRSRDSKIDFVGSYKSTTFKNRGEVKGLKPSVYVNLIAHTRDPKAKSADLKYLLQVPYLRGVFFESLPGDNKILTLNEVEIMSGGKNVALSGKAKQSSLVRVVLLQEE